jgi:di/tricarboxylate transporter
VTIPKRVPSGRELLVAAVVVGLLLVGLILAAPAGGLTECDRTECGWGWDAYRAAAWALLGLFVVLLLLGVGAVLRRRRI